MRRIPWIVLAGLIMVIPLFVKVKKRESQEGESEGGDDLKDHSGDEDL